MVCECSQAEVFATLFVRKVITGKQKVRTHLTKCKENNSIIFSALNRFYSNHPGSMPLAYSFVDKFWCVTSAPTNYNSVNGSYVQQMVYQFIPCSAPVVQ